MIEYKLNWIGYSQPFYYKEASYEEFTYMIEKNHLGKNQLLIKIDDHWKQITGGQRLGKIMRLAEKDLERRLSNR